MDSNNKTLTDSGDSLENLNFSEVFAIVDMQDQFISKNSNTYEQHYLKLRNNIMGSIEAALNNNGLILNIEYKDRGDIISPIKKVLSEEGNRVITLTKGSMNLISDYNEYGESLKIEDTLKLIKYREVITRIGGIHTSKCVHAVARDVYREGIDTKVVLGNTLNLHLNEAVFEKENQLPEVRFGYGKLSGLLDYGNKPINLKYLTDYL